MIYQIHNTTKDVRTRTTRVQSPGNPKTRLFLSGGQLQILRKRPQQVSEEVLRRLLPELIRLETAGRCMVTTTAGQRVDLKQMAPAVEAPAATQVVAPPVVVEEPPPPPPVAEEEPPPPPVEKEVPIPEEEPPVEEKLPPPPPLPAEKPPQHQQQFGKKKNRW